jgi:hypothetical protein
MQRLSLGLDVLVLTFTKENPMQRHLARKKSLRMLVVFVLLVYLCSLTPFSRVQASGVISDWTPMTITDWAGLNGVWGSSASDVYAVGEKGTILHYDGREWQQMISGTSTQDGVVLNSVWGSSNRDIFVVGRGFSTTSGLILHYNGEEWQQMPSGTRTPWLYGVWGSSASNVYAVGHAGTILHYNGNSWSPIASGTSSALKGIWGSGPNDVFVVGDSGLIMHYNGVSWSETTATDWPINSVWGTSASNVFAVGSGGILHYNGIGWRLIPSGTTGELRSAWGSGPNDVYAVGDNYYNKGTIYHYNGSRWEFIDNFGWRVNSVWVSDTSNAFFVGRRSTVGFIVHHKDSNWHVMDYDNLNNMDYDAMWGTSDHNIFAVRDQTSSQHRPILHYDGMNWKVMPVPMNYYHASLYDIWGSSASDVFAVGYTWPSNDWNGTILHYDGNNWEAMTSGTDMRLYSIWGSSASDVFAVGWNGTILHYNGSSWSPIESGTSRFLRAVWGSGPNDVFVVGDSGLIMHYNGSSWNSMASGTTRDLYSLWGSSANDVYAVGQSGTILHYDGREWQPMIAAPDEEFSGMWGSGTSNVLFGLGKYSIFQYVSIPQIVVSSPPVAAGSINPGSRHNLLYALKLDVTSGDTILNDVKLTTQGTYRAGEITNLRLWYSSDATFDPANDTLLGRVNIPTARGGVQTFSSFNRQKLTQNSSSYLFVTVDVAADAQAGSTVAITGPSMRDISFSVGIGTGVLGNGGAQDISSSAKKVYLPLVRR